MNIQGLCSNFVEYESFLESNSPDILALCETDLPDSIDSGNFSVMGYLHLIRKDYISHIDGFAVYVKEGLFFAGNLSLENSAESYLCFQWALLHSVSYFFFLYPLSFSSTFFIFIQFLILFQMKFSGLTHLLMRLSLETLKSIIRTD